LGENGQLDHFDGYEKKMSFLSFEDGGNPSPFWPFHAPARSCLNFIFFLGDS
jgi:hypothetical protein